MKKDSLMTKQQLIAEEQKRLFKNRKVVQLNKFIKGDVSPFTVNDLKIFKYSVIKFCYKIENDCRMAVERALSGLRPLRLFFIKKRTNYGSF